jgi:DNA invertase Pin-like site-specific DNA recombinase
MTNVVIYNRVARNDQQDPQTSPDGQLARILAHVAARGWANVAEYADDNQGGDAE